MVDFVVEVDGCKAVVVVVGGADVVVDVDLTPVNCIVCQFYV